jgi:hypothetical protein
MTLLSRLNTPKFCGDITSTSQANPQSRQHLENRGPEEVFFRCQSRQHTENATTYKTPVGMRKRCDNVPDRKYGKRWALGGNHPLRVINLAGN